MQVVIIVLLIRCPTAVFSLSNFLLPTDTADGLVYPFKDYSRF